MKRKPVFAAIAAAFCATMATASAHIVLAVRDAPAGSYYKAVFQVPHGCNGAATTTISVDLPPGILVAKPMPKPGWQLTILHEPLAQPAVNEGHQLTERVKSVRWDGGRLPDNQFDEFVIMVRLPTEDGPLSFPVVQSCGDEQVAWVQERSPDAAPPPHPAPSVLLTKTSARE